MSVPRFSPTLPLENVDRDYDGVSLTQVVGKSIVSVAIPLKGEKKLRSSILQSFDAQMPEVGQSTTGKANNMILLGMQIDQIFLYFDERADVQSIDLVNEELGHSGYYTDQSDSWAVLKLSGPKVRAALERICMLDLAADKFAPGAVARTQMEHLGVIIYRSGRDEFTLFSARSSAKSFHHAIETSITNVSEYA